MPTYVLRSIQRVAPGKWEEKLGREKRFDAIEARLGDAVARRYQAMLGAEPSGTYVKEYEYDSLGAMQAALEKEMADAEFRALLEEARENPITLENRFELYVLLPSE